MFFSRETCEEDNLECSLCDGFPCFDSFSDAEAHFGSNHLDDEFEKWRLTVATTEDYSVIRDFREKCGIAIDPQKTSSPISAKRQRSPESPKNSRGSKKFRSSSADKKSSEVRKACCPKCRKIFDSKEECEDHLALRHYREELKMFLPRKRQRYNCYCQKYVTDDIDQIVVHLARVHKGLRYVQSKRNKISLSSQERPNLIDSLYKSIPVASRRKDAPSNMFACQVHGCKYSTPDKSKIATHSHEHVTSRLTQESELGLISEETNTFVCHRCLCGASTMQSLRLHLTRQHLKPDGFKRPSQVLSAAASQETRQPPPAKEKVVDKRRLPQLNDQSLGDFLKGFLGSNESYKDKPEAVDDEDGLSELDSMSNFLQVDTLARRISTTEDSCDYSSDAQLARLDNKGKETIWLKSLSEKKYPTAKHEWLCDGKLLLLEDPRAEHNMDIFQVVSFSF